MQNFTLLPFFPFAKVDNSVVADININIQTTMNKIGSLLTLHYELIGHSKVILPVHSNQFQSDQFQSSQLTMSPLRKDELWKNTCFEFFIAEQGQNYYWEFNLSPSGDWNIYYFEDYRQGMIREQAIDSLPFVVERRGRDTLTLTVTVDLAKIIPKYSQNRLDIAMTTVIRDSNNKLSYWALKHCGTEPDFHHRRSFIST